MAGMGDKFSPGEAPEDSVFAPKGRSYLQQFSDWLKPDTPGEPYVTQGEDQLQPGQEPDSTKATIKRGIEAVEGPRPVAGPDTASEPMSRTEISSFAETPPKGPAARPAERQGIKKASDTMKKAAAAGDSTPALKFSSTVESEASRTLPRDEAEEFRNEMRELKTWLKTKNEDIDRQQLIETVGNALTQLAGGLYGLRHGQDMSGMKFDKTDWDKRRGLAMEEFRANLQDLGEQRKEYVTGEREKEKIKAEKGMLGFKEGADTARAKTRETAETERLKLRLAMDKYLGELNASAREGGGDAAEAKAKKKALNGALVDLSGAAGAKSEDKKDSLMESAKNKLLDAGLEPDQINKIMTAEPGFLDSLLNLEPGQAEPQEAAANVVKTKMGAAPQSAEVERQLPDGKIGIFDSTTKKFLRYKGQ